MGTRLDVPFDSALFDRVLQDIVRRIVEVAHPEKIILFGSAARGAATADSDVDLLVIKKCDHRRRLTGEIYRRLVGVGWPVDVIVVWPEDVERFRHSVGTIIEPSLREGRVVYAQ